MRSKVDEAGPKDESSSSRKLFQTKNIASLRLMQKASLATRMDLIPFVAVYSVFVYMYLNPQPFKDYFVSRVVPPLFGWSPFLSSVFQLQVYTMSLASLWMCVVACFAQLIVGLLQYWHNSIRCQVQFHSLVSSSTAQVSMSTNYRAYIVPPPHCGEDAIVPVEFDDSTDAYFISFQSMKYVWNGDAQRFEEICFPIAEAVSYYLQPRVGDKSTVKSLALKSAVAKESVDLELLKSRFGDNKFVIPMPQFMEIFQTHLTSPFFLFQLFCVGLWCLDDYWMYSLFTLFMLLTFEVMTVKRRMGNMQMIRNMRTKPYTIWVYRNCKWSIVQSTDLVPNDIISLSRTPAKLSDLRSDDEDDYSSDEESDMRSAASEIVIPCDALLLRGTCVVDEALLTGESVPQIKEPLDTSKPDAVVDLKSSVYRSALVSGGTKIVLSDSAPTAASADLSSSQLRDSLSRVRTPPDCGAVCFVVRTGFNTCQGELLRTILFSTSRVSVNNPEAFYFLLILLCFAVCFASYVLYWSLQDETRTYFKITLNVISILTSVVPPELPMELSLAVNNSLIKLMQYKIFCTEAFRIPFAGALDVCCFDKTGTLTSDSFQVVGCTKLDARISPGTEVSLPSLLITDGRKFTFDSTIAIAGCHSLVSLRKKRKKSKTGKVKKPRDALVVGDPLEKSSLASMGWKLSNTEDHVCHNEDGSSKVKIWHRFPFSSALKRMSCIVSIRGAAKQLAATGGSGKMRLVCKGAAEEIGRRLKAKPHGYDNVNGYFSRRGFRVLALAWRPLADGSVNVRNPSQLRSLNRDDFEDDLRFAGFLVFATPHKPDSMDTLLQLKHSTHAVVMITGDHWLTACAVARDIKLVEKPIVTLSKCEEKESKCEEECDEEVWSWRHFEEEYGSETIGFDAKMGTNVVSSLVAKYSLCLTGGALAYARSVLCEEALVALVINCSVYARTSPQQKEYILSVMKAAGLQTLMCGDGTNDVGALKQSHVGVALLSESAAMQIKKSEKQSIERKKSYALNRMSRFGGDTMKRMRDMQQEKERKKKEAERKKREDELEELMNPESVEELQKKLWAQLVSGFEDGGSGNGDAEAGAGAGMDELKPVQLGDASIAAPFTSKLSSIESCMEIVKEGRCTLVTTLQMFAILALNSLITGYSLTLMYTDGIKYGDTQMTITGMLTAALFFFITRSEAAPFLSKEKPHTSVFTKYMCLSMFGQAFVHLSLMYYCVRLSKPHTPTDEETRDWRGKFKPNVLNTVVFLVSTTQTVASFLANYAGYPFMQPLTENKKLWRVSMLLVGICFTLALNWFPEWSTFMQCAPLPSEEFRQQLVSVLVVDLCVSVGWERLCRALFRTSAVHSALCSRRIDRPKAEEMKEVYSRYRQKKRKEHEQNKQPGFWQTMKENVAMAQEMHKEQQPAVASQQQAAGR